MDNEAFHYNEFILYKNANNTEVAAIKLKDASQDSKIDILATLTDSNK